MIIAITQDGFVKKTPKSEFKAQKIGSNGVFRSFYADGIKTIREASLEDTLLLFTEQGKCYRIEVMDIPSTRISEKGLSLKERFNIVNDNFCVILPIKSLFTSENIDDYEIVVMTKQWKIVRQKLICYKDKKQGIKTIELNPNDKLVDVVLANNEEFLFNCNIYGFGKLICLQDIPTLSLRTKGVVCGSNGYYNRSICKSKLLPNAPLVQLDICNNIETSHVLVTNQGCLGRILPSPLQGRATSGPRLLDLRENDTIVYNSFATDNENLLIVTAKGYTLNLRFSDFKICKQGIKGTLCIKIADDDNIIACCKISPSKEIVLNIEKFDTYKQETKKSQSLLSDIFVDKEEIKTYFKSDSDSVVEMLKILFAKDVWKKDELESICKNKGLILGAILEEINDYSYSKIDDGVVEDDGDNIYVTLDYKEDLL